MDELPSILAGRYRLERRLGEGGMGTVWAAVHVESGARFAIKLGKKSAGEDAP